MLKSITRRQFARSAARMAGAVGIATLVPRHVLGGPGTIPPSEKLNVAGIGIGGMGAYNLANLEHENIVALCDVDADYAAPTIKKYPGAKFFSDYREMLDKQKDIDAVVVATPDHTHAIISIAAMKAGKHVYCEKPLTHNLWEARMVAKVAKETGVATQMGNHGRSSEGHRQTVEWIQDGAIGQVREVHAWANAGNFAQGHGRPRETPPVPPGLNWDLWLGPREARPYHPAYAPFNWRGWWAFGGGGIPDVAPHHLDPAFDALQLDAPQTVEATGPGIDEEVCSTGVLATYRFGARGDKGPLTAYWYDGGLRPPTPAGVDPDDPKQRMGEGPNGIFFVGEKGIVTCGGWSGMPRLLPLELHRDYKRPPKTLPRVAGHHADWLQACKGGTPACSNFDYASRLTEFVLLGCVALRVRKQIKWDAANLKATNAPNADPYLKEAYRPGWELPL
jgi:predicted dehydrogenase